MERTPAYWPTRIMLAVGIVATAAVLALAWMAPGLPGLGDPMFGVPATVLGLPVRVVGDAAAVAASLVGLVWMVRVFRGPRERPTRWRYRDRR